MRALFCDVPTQRRNRLKRLALAALFLSITGCASNTDCVAGPNQACPSGKFLKSYAEADDMQKHFAKVTDNLQAMMPQPVCNLPARVTSDCWQYNQNLQKFVKVIPPPPIQGPPAVPGVPAPGATK